ncbi:NTP transferase domain-containing protein [Sphingomonas cavernae]|uniref:NTP transferase domain-containing protein n=1 Tax=Sphingomonas cavernae TaxID=2320861 RepID=UPI001EE54386|nr:NTP transferase domain-containing protein [Sphingomonas cavernae]
MSYGAFTVLILAAQRTGQENPLAVEHGVSHKCLVPICGKPLIAHVLDTLTTMDDLRLIRISIEPEAVAALTPLIESYAPSGVKIEFVPSAESIADSVLIAAAGVDGPYVITTADNVLLTHFAVNEMRRAFAEGADVTAALATRGGVLAAHPEGQRRFYEFSDDGYSNCNLYGIAGAKGMKAAEIFREGGQFAKNPKRLINAFGLFNILLMKYKLISLKGAMKRVSRRFGLKFDGVVLADGSHAIDVDNERTYRIAEGLLAKRLGQA